MHSVNKCSDVQRVAPSSGSIFDVAIVNLGDVPMLRASSCSEKIYVRL